MRRLTPIRLTVGLASLMLAQSGWAIGTTAGTVVQNTAVLDYSIGGTPQTQIASDVSDFTVDRKVDLTVTGDQGANYIVAPLSLGATPANVNNKLRYKLKNEGNSEQAFTIAVSHLTSEQFDAENCMVEVAGASAASTAAAVAIATQPTVTLAEDEEVDITVTCDMPDLGTTGNLVEDGDLSTLEVLATAVDGAGATMTESDMDNEDGLPDTVLADEVGGAADVAGGNDPNTGSTTPGDRNAMHSDTQTYEINAPELSVVKTSAVITDPFNCTQSDDATDLTASACSGNDPKRIPGSVIEYTMTISNASDAEATGVTLTDIVDTDQDGAIAGNTVEFVAGSITVDGVVMTDGGDADSGEYTAATETVTADGLTVPASGSTTVTFRVKID